MSWVKVVADYTHAAPWRVKALPLERCAERWGGGELVYAMSAKSSVHLGFLDLADVRGMPGAVHAAQAVARGRSATP